ncbi:MAG: Clp1/GlmU family protein [Sedimenticola sp.]
MSTTIPLLPPEPDRLVDSFFNGERRAMLFGQPGIGKTTLTNALAARLDARGKQAWCIGADPGSPLFGLPGAVSLGLYRRGEWALEAVEGLCSLDAARFRLPLISAVGALARQVTAGTLLLDAPGVVRGVAGAELLTALVETAGIDLLLVLLRDERSLHLPDELASLDAEVVYVSASAEARRPGKATRARSRTWLWDSHLEAGSEQRVAFDRLKLLGTPPRKAPEAWLGKQVAFLQDGHTRCMGEVTRFTDEGLSVKIPEDGITTDTLLVRDACRDESGLLGTSKPFAGDTVRYLPPADLVPDSAVEQSGGERPMVHAGPAIATLMNGVFGDPLLHLRLRQQRRSLLFDLGEGARLPARIAHQVSDVFISHGHMDHICGFLWLLRSRIGEEAVCRLFGPPGLSVNIQGLIKGVLWDRIGDRGPRFEVVEYSGDRIQRFLFQAGIPGYEYLGEMSVERGALLSDPAFTVRAVTLDHGTPVLAFAYEPEPEINVRKHRLRDRKLEPGPWLNRLKDFIRAGRLSQVIELPGGQKESVEALARDLVRIAPGSRLVYATDFADTPDNRSRVIGLSRGAHTLFCEATFMRRDEQQAIRTGHLTTRACGEIAQLADVQHLVPFHFSRRYEDDPRQIYREIAEVCSRVVIPRG